MKLIMKLLLILMINEGFIATENTTNEAQLFDNQNEITNFGRSNDSILIARRKAHYLEHPEKGNLTSDREGAHAKAKVPKGRKGEDNSGITLGLGIDLAAGFSKPRARERIADAIDAEGDLRAWIMRVPATRGEKARTWLKREGNQSPIFNQTQMNQLYEFGYDFFLERARKRLLGITGYPIADVLPAFRLTEAEYKNLALDPTASDQDYIYEFLADLAWNSGQFARGRQNLIAKALRVDNDDLSRVDRQIMQLQALRNLIRTRKIPTSRSGRINRLAWIDSKVELLSHNEY